MKRIYGLRPLIRRSRNMLVEWHFSHSHFGGVSLQQRSIHYKAYNIKHIFLKALTKDANDAYILETFQPVIHKGLSWASWRFKMLVIGSNSPFSSLYFSSNFRMSLPHSYLKISTILFQREILLLWLAF